MKTFFVQRDLTNPQTLYCMVDNGTEQRMLSGPFRDHTYAWAMCERAARAAQTHEGGEVLFTVKPEDVAQREYHETGQRGSRSAWIVRR